jgi:hypothetical protein
MSHSPQSLALTNMGTVSATECSEECAGAMYMSGAHGNTAQGRIGGARTPSLWHKHLMLA